MFKELFVFALQKEASDSELREKMHSAINFYYGLVKVVLETIKLMKNSYKGNCFGESTIFRLQVDSKKGVYVQNWYLSLAAHKVL